MRRLPGGAVTALGITQLIGWGTSFYLPAVFAHRIAEDTGWSLTLVFAGFSWNLIVAGAMSRRIGEMIDRLGAPRVMTIGSALMAMGLLMLATATTTVQLFAAWTILGVASRAALYDAAFAALAAIFGQGARRAISLLTLWGGLASTVFWPLGHFLVEAIDWRWSTAVYALLNLGVCLPLHRGFAAMHAPAPIAAPPAAAAAASPATPAPAPASASGPAAAPSATSGASANPRFAGAARDRALLVFSSILASYSFVFSSLSAHLIVVFEGLGLAAATAVSIAALKGVAQVAARFLELLGQRWMSPLAVGVVALALLAAGLLMMRFGPASTLPVSIACLVYGAANGLVTIVRGSVPLVLFGTAGYAGTLGRLAAPSLVSSALAPLAFAWLIERWGVHAGLTLLTLIAMAACAGMLWLARPSPRPIS